MCRTNRPIHGRHPPTTCAEQLHLHRLPHCALFLSDLLSCVVVKPSTLYRTRKLLVRVIQHGAGQFRGIRLLRDSLYQRFVSNVICFQERLQLKPATTWSLGSVSIKLFHTCQHLTMQVRLCYRRSTRLSLKSRLLLYEDIVPVLDVRVSLTEALFQRVQSAEHSSISESRHLAPLPTCEDGPNLWCAMTRMKIVSWLISTGP